MDSKKAPLNQTEKGTFRNDWSKRIVGDFVEIKHGYAFKGEFFIDEPNGRVVLTPGNFYIGGGFKTTKLKYTNETPPPEYVLQEGDIIVTMTDLSKNGDTLGYSAKVPPSQKNKYLHNQRIGLLRFKSKEILPDYLHWVLRTKRYNLFVVGSASGSTVKHTSPERIKAFNFELPSCLQEQNAIATFLSNIESRITLNQEMNWTLEAIGEAVFRRWFVDFEFLNQEGKPYKSTGGKLESTDFGEMPAGWSMKPFSEVIAVNPTRKIEKGAKKKKVEMADLNPWQLWIASWANDEFKSGSRFKNGDTLLARITPCLENGKTAFVSFLDENEVAFGSTEFIVLGPKAIQSNYFILYLVISNNLRASAILSMTGSSGRQRVPNDFFDDFMIAVPPNDVLSRFDSFVTPLFAKITHNMKESRYLAEIRNLLLPKLMSGKIRIPINKENTEPT